MIRFATLGRFWCREGASTPSTFAHEQLGVLRLSQTFNTLQTQEAFLNQPIEELLLQHCQGTYSGFGMTCMDI
jgi:hypothetical protein